MKTTRKQGVGLALAASVLAILFATSSPLQADKETSKASPAIPPPPQRVEPRSADAIAYMFHGSYMNAKGEVIPNPSKEVLEAFQASQTRTRDAASNPRDYAAYCRDCLAEGVPEPPAFSSSDWTSKGGVASKFTSEEVIDIKVYESADPPGVCVALPRGSSGSVNLVGVICQSQRTGKACFWDNVSNETGVRITASSVQDLEITKFQNGDQLQEDCTDCHRGENVYLVHDELYAIPARDPDARYQPIPTGTNAGGGFWSNPGRRRDNDPDERNLMREEGCGGCHTMPSLSEAYCNSVLTPSITRGLMPPQGALSVSDRDSLYCRDFCLLNYECRLLQGGAMEDQAAQTTCDCDARWWVEGELWRVPPEANPD